MRNVILGVLVGLMVGVGLTWAGTFEEMERQQERRSQEYERFNAQQERDRVQRERNRVPLLEPVYPGLGRGPC